MEQLTLFKVGDGLGKFNETTLLYQRLDHYFNNAGQHEKSLQFSKNTMLFSLPNMAHAVIILLSLPVLLVIFFAGKIQSQLKPAVFVLAAIVLNAWCCGTFANAIDRLGSKTMWLIPGMAFIGMYVFLKKRKPLTHPHR